MRGIAKEKAEAARRGKASSQQPKYRDRALERRITYGQPDAPVPADSKSSSKKRIAEGPPPPPPPPAPPVAPIKDDNNMGNKLLKKMGWAEGSGLGTSGEGRVDPV